VKVKLSLCFLASHHENIPVLLIKGIGERKILKWIVMKQNRIELTQDKIKWQVLVNMVLILWIS
jgi:hypothetical protein